MKPRSIHVETDGVVLHASVAGIGRPVVVLHGFTGSVDSVAAVATALRPDHRTLCIDLIGHGASDAPREIDAYRMERCVDQVAGVLQVLGATPAHVIGYSMGGRVALSLCAWCPDLVSSVIAIGARAGFDDEAERAARIRDDCTLADRIERDGVLRFIDDWMAQPIFASQQRLGSEALATARRQRLANRAHGLAWSLRGMGAGAQPPLHGSLRGVQVPVLLVVGEEDLRFRSVSDELAALLPLGRTAVIPEAGHAAHLENPGEFTRVARRFIAAADADPLIHNPRRRIPAPIQRTPSS